MSVALKYKYALDENGSLITIENVDPVSHLGRRFKCLSCGNEMEAVMGEERRYFRHVRGATCSEETYLHKLAKLLLEDKFKNSDSFVIKFQQEVPCIEQNQCKVSDPDICKGESVMEFDLKKYYNQCAQEKEVQGFVADVLLYNDQKLAQEPVLIEICVSHPCSDEKIHSGLKIIEIQICSEEDISYCISHPLTDHNATFYNFKAASIKPRQLSAGRFTRFVLFQSGAAWVNNLDCPFTCEQRHIRRRNNSVLELNFPTDVNLLSGAYQYGLAYARKKGIDVRNCNLCKFYKASTLYSTRTGKICVLFRKCLTPMDPDLTYAKQCDHYVDDPAIMNEVGNIPIEEV